MAAGFKGLLAWLLHWRAGKQTTIISAESVKYTMPKSLPHYTMPVSRAHYTMRKED